MPQEELTSEQMQLLEIFMSNGDVATALILNAIQNNPVMFELTLQGLAPHVKEAFIQYFRKLNTFIQTNPSIKALIE